MTTIDWPSRLIPQTCSLRLRKSGQVFTSPFNGTTQALDYLSERWLLSVSLAELQSRDPRGVASFLNFLAGGVNRVRGWHFGQRGQTRGSLAAAQLAWSFAQGATALTLSGCRNRNLWTGGSFEIDTNADGLADGWTPYSSGSTGAITYSRNAGPLYAGVSGYYQSAFASALNGRVGISRAFPVTAGTAYSLSLDQTASPGTTVYVSINWLTAGAAYISEATASAIASSGRRSVSGVAPAGAATALVYIFIESAAGAAALLNVDQAQFEAAGAPTAWAGFPTLLSDDLMRLDTGQLVEVLGDCTANDAGQMDVPITSHLRTGVLGGSAVTLQRPYAEFMLPAMEAGAVWSPGRIASVALDLVEVWG